MPVGIGQFQNRRTRAFACGVDQHIDPAPAFHDQIDQLLDIGLALVGAGDADATQLLGQCFALAGGRQQAHVVAVSGKFAGSGCAHAGACGDDDGGFIH